MAERNERSGFRARFTDHIAVAVGTTKGLFIVNDGVPDGPFFRGWQVPAFLQHGGRFLAAVVDARLGCVICRSDDGGVTWQQPADQVLAFPPDAGAKVVQVWQLHADSASGGPVVYAGVQPAALFRSEDAGESFQLVRGLWDHPDRQGWTPAYGGLGLHSVLTHPQRPQRLIVGVSNGGVYVSENNGHSFEARNRGLEPPIHPERGIPMPMCVHKLALDPTDPDMLWAQSHWGIFRSFDAGGQWEDVGRVGAEDGTPTGFGFPMVSHPIEANTAFVEPLDSQDFPFSANADCAVYRTTDGGKHWEGYGRGLPRTDAYITVLRDALDMSDVPPYPLVFGTRAGDLYASADGGENWRRFVEHLPPILCVRVLQ